MLRDGIVGFFDILGYQNIIDNNDIENVSKIVTDILLNLGNNVRMNIIEQINDKALYNRYAEGMDIRLISDSILLTLPYNSEDIRERNRQSLICVAAAQEILNMTFKKGIPVRGAMNCGKFYLEESCFAGKPLIECYRVGQSLDFSGCAMLTDLENVCREYENNGSDFNILTTPLAMKHYCPLKSEKFKEMYIVTWGHYMIKDDIRQVVYEGYKMHNKDIGIGVARKIENTEYILRTIKMNTKE